MTNPKKWSLFPIFGLTSLFLAVSPILYLCYLELFGARLPEHICDLFELFLPLLLFLGVPMFIGAIGLLFKWNWARHFLLLVIRIQRQLWIVVMILFVLGNIATQNLIRYLFPTVFSEIFVILLLIYYTLFIGAMTRPEAITATRGRVSPRPPRNTMSHQLIGASLRWLGFWLFADFLHYLYASGFSSKLNDLLGLTIYFLIVLIGLLHWCAGISLWRAKSGAIRRVGKLLKTTIVLAVLVIVSGGVILCFGYDPGLLNLIVLLALLILLDRCFIKYLSHTEGSI